MEKQLEWESSNIAIKTTVIKLQNQSGCLLLTLKQEDHAHASKSKSFMVKSGRNNGGIGENMSLLDGCASDGREEGGEDNNIL